MIRKIVCILSTVGLLTAARLPALAQQNAGLCVRPSWCGTAVAGGTVTVTSVGRPVAGGYALTDGLADWVIWDEEVDTGKMEDWILRANRGVSRTKAVKEAGAEFTDLEPGLYLVSQEEAAPGYSPFPPFLLELPQGEGQNDVVAPTVLSLQEAPHTGDHPAPIIAAMIISFLVAVCMILADRRNH